MTTGNLITDINAATTFPKSKERYQPNMGDSNNFYGSLRKSNIRNLNYISLSHQAILPISLWEKLHTIDKTQSYRI